MVAGAVLLVLAVILALRAVLASAGTSSEAAPAIVATGAEASKQPLVTASTSVSAKGSAGSATAPGGTAAGSGHVVVHVTGAVTRPGVVTLGENSRVADAIDAAGGASANADTEQLNLARILTDGEQVRVPRVGEVLVDPAAQPTGAGSVGAGTTSGKPGGGDVSGTVNINTASASELEKLPGIGPALAQRIVEYRDSHGHFVDVNALTEVPGIGKAKLEALRDQVTV